MPQVLAYFITRLNALLSDERGQDTFEYVLIIGGVVVAVIAAITTPVGSSFIHAVVEGVCNAITHISTVSIAGCATL